MSEMRIPHQGLVVVGDGRKALFLANHGRPDAVKLIVTDVLEAPENPPTSAQGAQAPGRAFRAADGRRSAVEQTDWHRLAALAFARQVGQAIEHKRLAGDVDWIALVAPASILSQWRKTLSDACLGLVGAQLVKDLTKHPAPEIERLLTQAHGKATAD